MRSVTQALAAIAMVAAVAHAHPGRRLLSLRRNKARMLLQRRRSDEEEAPGLDCCLQIYDGNDYSDACVTKTNPAKASSV